MGNVKIEKIAAEVERLMATDQSGHGFDHIKRVYDLALNLAAHENADIETVALAALLHDCDDYKLVGAEAAGKLGNARLIMDNNGVEKERQQQVLDIIARMGYSKRLQGICPLSTEGHIVSDADMLDAIGISGVIRTLQYALIRCNSNGKPIFDPSIWPETELSAEEYKKSDRRSDNFINHFFEKLLKLKNMMFTAAAREEAEIRHQAMTGFLYHFFRENNLPEWGEYLENYQKGPI